MAQPNDSTEAPQGAVPYISFRTLLNLIERMADEGIPRRIDRSYLSGLSGGYQTQVMAALRGLSLINDEGTVAPSLIDLVQQPNSRKAILRQILMGRYPEAVRLGESNATQAELEDSFRPFGITGTTLRKAVAFYLHAAEFAEIPVSPFFKSPSTSSEGGTSKRRKPRAPKPATPPPTPTVVDQAPSAEQLKTRYIEMLLKRVEGQDDMDDKLLDRIEVLLGFQGEGDDRPQD